MGKFSDLIIELLKDGVNPNDLQREFDGTVWGSKFEWVLWGDDKWHKDTVCSICGSEVPGICGHRNNPGREIILRSEYKRRKGAS